MGMEQPVKKNMKLFIKEYIDKLINTPPMVLIERAKIKARIVIDDWKKMIIKLVLFFVVLVVISELISGNLPPLNGLLIYLPIGILFVFIVGFYSINKQEIDYLLMKYFGLTDTFIYVNVSILSISALSLVTASPYQSVERSSLSLLIVSTIVGFSLLFYNLKDCLNQKKLGLIWWPRFMIAIPVSVVALVVMMSYLEPQSFINTHEVIYVIIYLAIVIGGVIRLLKFTNPSIVTSNNCIDNNNKSLNRYIHGVFFILKLLLISTVIIIGYLVIAISQGGCC